MASKSPQMRLLHIQQEADWMLALYEETTYAAFSRSIRDIRAVEHGFLIISEAARTLPTAMTEAHPEVDWSAIRGFGNVLRHDYQQITPERLWATMRDYLPGLQRAIMALRQSFPD
jgi:uncharacterized protein with HEPN domain